jgi:hypothetical protein
MPKHRLRLLLAGAMAVALLLLWNPLCPPGAAQVTPSWVYVLWGTTEAISAMLRGIQGRYFVNALCIALSLPGVPLPVLLNICLGIWPSDDLDVLYRVLALSLVPLTWYRTLLTDQVWRGSGFWANTAMITAAALIETALLIRKRVDQPKIGDQRPV